MDNHEHNATGGQTIQPRLWNRNYTRAWTANFMLYVSFMLIVPILPLYLNDTYGAGKHTIGAVLSGYTIAVILSTVSIVIRFCCCSIHWHS